LDWRKDCVKKSTGESVGDWWEDEPEWGPSPAKENPEEESVGNSGGLWHNIGDGICPMMELSGLEYYDMSTEECREHCNLSSAPYFSMWDDNGSKKCGCFRSCDYFTPRDGGQSYKILEPDLWSTIGEGVCPMMEMTGRPYYDISTEECRQNCKSFRSSYFSMWDEHGSKKCGCFRNCDYFTSKDGAQSYKILEGTEQDVGSSTPLRISKHDETWFGAVFHITIGTAGLLIGIAIAFYIYTSCTAKKEEIDIETSLL